MTRYTIVESTPEHVRLLRGRLRQGDMAELLCMGISAPKALWRSYKESVVRKSVYVDGQLAAMWGCSGSVLGGVGCPWLLTAPEIELIPIAFVKEARAEAQSMLALFPLLENYVVANYVKACRFLEVVGFSLDEPIIAKNGTPFLRFWMEK
jgi:hypothetical protein